MKTLKQLGLDEAEIFTIFDCIYKEHNDDIEATAKALKIEVDEAQEIADYFYGELKTLPAF